MREGHCQCGAVRYRVREPFAFVAHDHCGICRRVAGAAFVTWGGVLDAAFELVSGEGELTHYRSTPEGERQFCRRCGSHLFFRSSRWPGQVHFTIATLADQEGIAPQAHVYWSDRARWIDDLDLPKLGGATGMDPVG